jgi:Tol biopolymer transport system component
MSARNVLYVLLFTLFCFPQELLAQAQGTQTEFGKNRVQYKDFQWFYYRSPHFDTYYYKNGKEMGVTVGKLAEQNLKEIENILDYKLEGRIKILAYNKLSDLKQTNLGLVTESAANTGGLTQIVGNKIFVYFDGNTSHLRKQIRQGIAQVLINEMLYGGNIQEMLSNSTLLTLPDWFMPGLVSYISEEWNIELDNELKDGILSGRYKKFNRLMDNDAKIAGHSIWKYVVDNFGISSVSNIVYMTRVNKNAEYGFMYIIGLNFKELSPKWLDYYKLQFDKLDIGKTMPSADERFSHKMKKRTRKFRYDQFRISPDGKNYAYIVNRQGRFSVYVYDVTTEKTRRVFRAGQKSPALVTENSEPIISWHPSGILLAMSYEKKSEALIEIINLNDKKENTEVNMYKYEKVLDFDYSSDGRKWVISAIRNGQSDIYVFDIPSRRDEQITNDWYDDLNPRFIERSSKIVFSSNRDTDSLKKDTFNQLPAFNNYDLFYYNYQLRDPKLQRITNTPFVNETKPVEFDTGKVAYLSDANGVSNRYMVVLDSVIAYQYDTTIFWYDTTISVYRDTFSTVPVTNYSRNILTQDVSKRNRRLSEIIFNKNQSQVYIQNRRAAMLDAEPEKTPYRQAKDKKLQLEYQQMLDRQRQDSIILADSLLRAEQITDSLGTDSTAVPKQPYEENVYYFQTDFPRKKSEQTVEKLVKTDSGSQVFYFDKKEEKQSEFAKDKIPSLDDYFTKSSPIPYLPIFSTNYVVSQLDNSLLSNSYQQFTGVGPVFYNSSINALIKVGTSDLMEDYRFSGGFRLAGDLTIPEYYVSFENLKKRLDKQFIFYKQGGNDLSGFGAVRTNSYEVKAIVKWPFNEQASIRGTLFYRRDETIFLSTDIVSLLEPNRYEDNAGYKLEYVFDNTIQRGLNLYNGTRYKVYMEQYKELSSAGGDMINLGFDFRHYEKISRQIIFAARVAGASSILNEKVMYYLGAVDNWIVPRFNRNIQIDQTRNYKYQALATNMRGFTQNIRNGNNFAVINTEIRIPVFAYLLNRPIKSDFVKNFQIVPFGDVGAAWVGSDPMSAENRYNRIVDQSETSPVKLTIIEPKYPVVGGFGGGLRTRIFGYFIRFDTAWGVQNSKVEKKPAYYFSLSLDF